MTDEELLAKHGGDAGASTKRGFSDEELTKKAFPLKSEPVTKDGKTIKKPYEPGFFLGDIAEAAGDAWRGLKSDFATAFPSMEEFNKQNAAGVIPSLESAAKRAGATVRLPLDAAGLVFSPVTGALHATVGRGAAKVLPGVSREQANEVVDDAMMGLRPTKGSVGPPHPVGAIISPERAALAKEAREVFNLPVTGPQIGKNPTTKFAESTIRHLPFSGAGSEELALQQAFTREVAKTFGEDATAITQTVMDGAKKRIGGVMNTIEEGATVNLTPAHLERLAEISEDASKLPKSEWEAIKGHLEDAIKEIQTGDTIEGRTFAKIFRHGSPLDRAVSSDSANVSYYGNKIKSVLQDALQESLTPEQASAYKDARFQYKNMKTIEPLVNKSPDGIVSPTALNGRVTAEFGNRAFDTRFNPLDRLAKIGQAFLKEPATSGTSERGAAKAGLVELGKAGAAVAAGHFIGIPPIAAGVATTIGAGRAAGKYLRSEGLANRTIERGLNPKLKYPGPTYPKYLPPFASQKLGIPDPFNPEAEPDQ